MLMFTISKLPSRGTSHEAIGLQMWKLLSCGNSSTALSYSQYTIGNHLSRAEMHVILLSKGAGSSKLPSGVDIAIYHETQHKIRKGRGLDNHLVVTDTCRHCVKPTMRVVDGSHGHDSTICDKVQCCCRSNQV